MFKKTKLCKGLLLAFGGTLALGALPAHAQDAQQSAPGVTSLDRVEVTGSSIKRLESQGALPVTVLTREDIQRTGANNMEQLLQTVSAMSSSQGLTASSSSGATTGGISAVSLRGLGSIRTLVLLNGRRIAPYGIGFTNDSVSVDVNSIPLAAVERVEVLTDGASAIYGSDAIAGVVNFILRKDFSGVELSADLGGSTQGGANTGRITGIWGKGDISVDKYNVMVMGSYQKETALMGADRNFAKTGYNKSNDTTSGNTYPANISAVDDTAYGNPSNPTGCKLPYSFLDPNVDIFGPDVCRFDPSPLVTLLPETERISFFASGQYAFTANITGYAEASYNRNSTNTVIQPVPISDQFQIPANNSLANQYPYNAYTAQPSSTIILTPLSPYYPTSYVQGQTGGATPDLLVRYRAAVNGNRDITDVAEAPRFVLGVKGLAADWDFDTTLLYSSSKVREQVNNGFPIYSKILPLLNSGTVNFFGDNTPAVESQLLATNFNGDAFEVKSSLTSLRGVASKDIAKLPAGPLSVAFGGEIRNEKYGFTPSTEIAQGDLSGYGGNMAYVDKSRNVYSVFGETNFAIVKGMEGDLALRYDNYQGVGGQWSPKFSLRWQPMQELLLRGAIGKGYRAPSLADLYSPTTQGVTINGVNDPERCPTTGSSTDCATQFATTNGGSSSLKAETSTNGTLGLILQPTKNVTMGVEGFYINLKNTINQGLPVSFILANLDKYSSYVTRGPVQPGNPGIPGPITAISQVNLNTGGTVVQGFDANLLWRIPTEKAGQFIIGLNGTYYSKFDVENPDGTWSKTVANMNQSQSGGVIPRYKAYTTGTWVMGAWATTLAYLYQDSYEDLPGNLDDSPHTVGSYRVWDLQTVYSSIKNLSLTVGIKNLFNTDPPYTNGGFAFQSNYDPQYADPRGRFIYGRVTYSFH